VLIPLSTSTTAVVVPLSVRARTATPFLAFGMLDANRVLAKSIRARMGTFFPRTERPVTLSKSSDRTFHNGRSKSSPLSLRTTGTVFTPPTLWILAIPSELLFYTNRWTSFIHSPLHSLKIIIALMGAIPSECLSRSLQLPVSPQARSPC